MKTCWRFILILASFVPAACVLHAPPIQRHDRPVYVARDYSLDEICEYSPAYCDKLKKALFLYEDFKNSLADSLRGFDELFETADETMRRFFHESISGARQAIIGLESIDIDSSYFAIVDTTRIKRPYFTILNCPVPIIKYDEWQFTPIGPIEDYFVINCVYGVVKKSSSGINANEYQIQIYARLIEDRLTIRRLKIDEHDSLRFKIPFLLRPFISIKK